MLREQPQGTDYTLFLGLLIFYFFFFFLVSELIFHHGALDSARLHGFTDLRCSELSYPFGNSSQATPSCYVRGFGTMLQIFI